MKTTAKPASLTEIVLGTLATADVPLTSSEIYTRNGAFENTTQIAGILNRLYLDKRVLREVSDGGRFVYRVNPDAESASDAGEPSHAEPAPRASRAYTRRSDAPKARMSETPSPSPPPTSPATAARGYVLFDHIANAMRDLDDLVADVIDRGASPDVVKCVVASSAALRRAQEAIYREARAA